MAMDSTQQTKHLFRFRQFLAGIEDHELLKQMRKCVDSQLAILPNFVQYVEPEPVKAVPVTLPPTSTYVPPIVGAYVGANGLHGWVPIGECPIVNPKNFKTNGKKISKGALIKYGTWATHEAKVTNRGAVHCSVCVKQSDGSYSPCSKKINYSNITHVWYA